MESSIVDSNARPLPLLHDPSVITEEYNLQRIVAIVAPFLALNPITSTALSVGMGAVRSLKTLNDIHQSHLQSNWSAFTWNTAKLAFVVSSVVFTIFFPTVGLLVTTGIQLVPDIYQLGFHLYQGGYMECGKDLLGIGSSVVYLGSILIGGPELLLLSLLAQGIKELGTSFKEFSRGRILEGVANMLLVAIRVHKAAPHAILFHRNYFGKTVTNDLLDEILCIIEKEQKGDYERKVDLGKILEQGYYSSRIRNTDFSKKNLSNLIIKDFSFQQCRFEESNLEGSLIENSTFDSCWMKNAFLIDTVVRNSIFSNSKLNDAVFFKSSLSNVLFSKVDLKRAYFNESTQKSVRYEDSKFAETNFLQIQEENTLFKNCKLTNTLLCDLKKTAQFENCTDNLFTKPVVAFAWNFRSQGAMASATEKVLREKKAISLRFDYHPDVDVDRLHQETQSLLTEIEKDQNIELSRLHEIMKRASIDGEVAKLQSAAKTIAENADGFMFPGGLDIEPEFYGEKNISSCPENDARRTLLEAALMKRAHESHKPIMAICRGSQLGNVFLGGTLHQDVEGQGGMLPMQTVKTGNLELDTLVHDLFGEGIQGVSAHHQASKDIAQGLHVVLSTDGIPKLMLTEDRNILLSQFHPEAYIKLKQVFREGRDREIKHVLDLINSAIKKIRSNSDLSQGEILERDLLKAKKHFQLVLDKLEEYIVSAEAQEKLFDVFLNQIKTLKS